MQDEDRTNVTKLRLSIADCFKEDVKELEDFIKSKEMLQSIEEGTIAAYHIIIVNEDHAVTKFATLNDLSFHNLIGAMSISKQNLVQKQLFEVPPRPILSEDD